MADTAPPPVLAVTDSRQYAELPANSLFQTSEWAKFKERFGWRAHYFLVTGGDFGNIGTQSPVPLLVLTRSLPIIRALRIAYAPHSILTTDTAAIPALAGLSSSIAAHLPGATLLLRWDTLAPQEARELFAAWKSESGGGRGAFRPAVADIQPPATVIVDLRKDNDTLLAAMKAKTRYNIRLAERKGIRIRPALRGELPTWYRLYKETATRDRIAIHSQKYYNDLLKIMNGNGSKRPRCELLFAEHNGQVISGIIASYYNGAATYLYGASSNRHRNLMATYLLQWQAMQRARELACTQYDLFGIPPYDDQNHAMAGLYRFKVGFGGDIVIRAGCWDWHLRRPLASLWRAAEKTYFFYHKTIRKR